MKLEDIPKKQPFQMPEESHFDSISSKIYAQLEKEETKSVSIHSQKIEKTTSSKFWTKPQFMGIAATFILLFVALIGFYKYNSDTNSTQLVAIETNQTEKIDFSKISTEQITTFLLDEEISETELVSFIPKNSSLESTSIFENSDLNSIDAESLDLMLEDEYL